MNAESLVTIGIPVYNEENYLAETIESAINQTYQTIQIIISDNCSTDRSFEIAQKYAEQDSRILLVRQEKNIGALENFKFVLEQAKSEYFCWLGAHDIFLSSYIQQAVSILNEKKNVGMTYPISRLIDVKGNQLQIEGSDIHTLGLTLEERLCKVANNLISCVSIHGLFRTIIAQKLPFKKTIGADHLMLFATAFYDDIYEIPHEGIFGRDVRKETIEQTYVRYKEVGIYSGSKVLEVKKLHAYLAYYHYVFLLEKRDRLKIFDTIKILRKLAKIFKNRFGVKNKDVNKVFWSNFFKI